MSFYLTVVEPFGNWQRGSHINDPEVIASVMQTHPHHVVQHLPPHPDFHKTDEEIGLRREGSAILNLKDLSSTSHDDEED